MNTKRSRIVETCVALSCYVCMVLGRVTACDRWENAGQLEAPACFHKHINPLKTSALNILLRFYRNCGFTCKECVKNIICC